MNKNLFKGSCKHYSYIKMACFGNFITVLAILLLIVILIPLLLFNNEYDQESTGICLDECGLTIVESIPTGLTFKDGTPKHMSTFKAWENLLENAEKSIDMAALYWNLRDPTNYTTSIDGRKTFDNIVKTAKRGIKIRIAQNKPSSYLPQQDSEYFQKNHLADVRSLDFPHLLGSGVLHTKFWIVDQKHVYIGSANMDWKSLTEVKELGVLIRNCSCIANDLNKIFSVYWRLGKPKANIPVQWPDNLKTKFNAKNPLQINYNSLAHKTFISNSPVEFNPKGREHDLNAIIKLMNNATKYIKVAVMDYLPVTVYMPEGKNYFWPNLDNAIRASAYRGISVQLLFAKWDHTKNETYGYLKSLLQINEALPNNSGQITIKLFVVPPAGKQQKKVPFTRVNHDKFMVTDKAAYVGTSNWIGDYFIATAGVGFIVENGKDQQSSQIIEQFHNTFKRDWDSEYAHPCTLKD